MLYRLLENTQLTETVWRMKLEGDTSAITAPGQFVQLSLPGFYLRRPISICDWDDKTITLVYKVVGDGTAAMAAMHIGMELDVLNGLGNGFDTGRCGDNDGPAYMVYSTTGFNKASFDVKLSEVQIQNYRKSDNLRLNAYIFLNADVYDEDNQWKNCFDAGFCFSSKRGWHLCYNLYTTITPGLYPWYESRVYLDPTHDYRLILDVSEKENQATLTAYDLTDDKVADSVTFEAAFTQPDGHNVSFTQNFALDYPRNVMFTEPGVPSTNDWMGIARYNTHEGVYMKDIRISNSTLYREGEPVVWTDKETVARSCWPDQVQGLEYNVVTVRIDEYDHSFEIDFNMNHPFEPLPEPWKPEDASSGTGR